MHLNIQGIKEKFEDLNILLNTWNNINIICLNEHNIKYSNKTILNKLTNYSLREGFFRNVSRGGSCILVHNSLSCKIRSDLAVLNVEMIFEGSYIEIESLNLVVISIYRIPGSDITKSFLGKLEKLFEMLQKEILKKRVIIAADFNINILADCSFSRDFTNIATRNGFRINIKESTRITKTSETCIDNILSSLNLDAASCYNIDLALSDHNALFMHIPYSFNLRKQKPINMERQTIRLFPVKQINPFLNSLHCHMDSLVLNSTVDGNYKEFLTKFLLCMHEFFPTKQIKTKHSNYSKKWITNGIIVSSINKRKLHLLAKTSTNPLFLQYVKNYKQIFKKVVHRAKKSVNCEYILNSNNKSKAMWNVVKDELGLRARSQTDLKLEVEGKVIDNPIQVAELFNCQYSNVVDTLKLPKLINNSYLMYDGNQKNDSVYIKLFNFTNEVEVKRTIMSLRNSTSSGWDGIPTKLLKWSADIISGKLAKLINQSFSEGVFPHLLKFSEVVPIFKKGSCHEIQNYRPISLLSSVSKVFERLIHVRLMNYLELNNKLCNEQYGFRGNLSTQCALFSFVNNVLAALDESKFTAAVFCDLSKAFDCVNHELLVSKLEVLGVGGSAIELIKSYLLGRKQRTVITTSVKKSYSSWTDVKFGVPQGSVLGPLLFIAYINDLPIYFSNRKFNFTFTLYADDTTTLIKRKTLSDLHNDVHEAIAKIGEWFMANGLLLNEDKTHILQFTLNNSAHVSSAMLGKSTTKSLKFLGVHLDKNLRWTEHTEHLVKKLNSVKYALSILVKASSLDVCKTVYYAYVYSLLSYGIVLWGSSVGMQQVFISQKSIVRVLAKCSYKASCRPIFRNLKLLTVPSIFILEILKTVHKNPDTFQIYNFKHHYNTRHCSAFQYPAHNSKKYEKGPLYMGLKLYNKIPDCFKDLPIKKFVSSIKNILIHKAYYSIDEFLSDDCRESVPGL